MDMTAILGSFLGLAAIVIGQWLSGGSLGQIFHFTALFIVLGGTSGAVLLAFPWREIVRALGAVPSIYSAEESGARFKPLVAEIVGAAQVARKEGILAIEGMRTGVKDALLKRVLRFVGEGYEPGTIREILDAEISSAVAREEVAARVFEAAGSYAPTLGVIGAVLSMLQALANLSDPSRIGAGIVSAFVATIYGIGLANLVFLPWASRLRSRSRARLAPLELVRIGVLGLLEGQTPIAIQEKLEIHVRESSAT